MQFQKHAPTGGFGDNSVVNFHVYDAQSIITKVSTNGLVKVTPPIVSALTAAAASVYGLTPANLQQAQGDCKTLSCTREENCSQGLERAEWCLFLVQHGFG